MSAKKGEVVDHINGDTLDNRRSNLRICTNRQNLLNRKKPSNNTSGFVGVHWNKQKNKWHTRINDRGHNYHVGYFDKPEFGALAYDWAASILYGEYARLNFPNKVGHVGVS
jgi:HNH endonuclease